MSSYLDYNREAIRVKVKKCNGAEKAEYRKFCVDPQLTSFEILRNLLARAFDIKELFSISYRAVDDYGQETYLAVLSDWDLDAAFLSASDPCLCLRVDLKHFEKSSPDDWDSLGTSEIATVGEDITSSDPKAANSIPNLIFNQMEKTFSSIVQRAFNFGEDQSQHGSCMQRPPLTDTEFRNYMDSVGLLTQPKELRLGIYQGGIEAGLRKVVWKHILNVYPEGLSGKDRMDYMKSKSSEYQMLRDSWKDMILKGFLPEELKVVTNMVRKDVLRTDRHHSFYAGTDDNKNIVSLFNILTTYALNHPSVGYCQGMSDLASPLLVTMNDEAHAYICFCALMQRLKPTFMLDGEAMTIKFQHLTEALMYYDPEFYSYLKNHQADDLLFCYRWLILELKREFAFDDSMKMLEVLWSSLPPLPRTKDLPLYELRFLYGKPTSKTLPKSKESAYTKLCAMRRRHSSSGRKSDLVWRQHKQNHSLDESSLSAVQLKDTVDCPVATRRILYSLDETSSDILNQTRGSPKHTPYEVLSLANNHAHNSMDMFKDTGSVNNRSPSFSSLLNRSVSLKEMRKRVQQRNSTGTKENIEKPSEKLVKNLNEFWNFAYGNRMRQDQTDRSENDDSKQYDCNGVTRNKTTNSSVVKTEYMQVTTVKMQELQQQLENFDSKVFGTKRSLSQSEENADTETVESSQYVWENPLVDSNQEYKTEDVFEDEDDSASETQSLLSQNTSVLTNSCLEVTETTDVEHPVSFARASVKLPPPQEFGGGNPFLMFLCLTLLCQHRDHIIRNQMDYNELAMHFDKMVRKHNVDKVLQHARCMFSEYLRQDWTDETETLTANDLNV